MTEDPAFALARHVTATPFAALPSATIAATTRDIIDTFGCILGGTGAPGLDALFEMEDHWGGRAESVVLLRERQLPAPRAALVNASAGHALDFDDTHDTAGSIHPGISVLAAGLAMADCVGGVDGPAFLRAIALGLDVSCRIALASTVDRGWHRTACIGVFGAAVTSGLLLGLDAEQMRHALGVAYSHAAGNRQCILDGALSKRLQAGQAAGAGVYAAFLARKAFTGAHNIFSGRYGFLELYQPGGHDASLLLRDLGQAFRGDGLSFKPYPCGRPLHAAIDAALAIRAELGLVSADKIADVTISLDEAVYADQFGGAPAKRRPTQVVEAQFALPFLVSTALVHGRVGIGDVAGLGDAPTLALSARIGGEIAPTRQPRDWAAITVRLTDGRTARVETSDPIGSPEKPLSEAALSAKFRDNAANARRPIPDGDIDSALHALANLRDLPDMRMLTRLFV